ncbi:heavy metal transporter [Candidatus Wolfebacteria bacterium]|nr:MAG: heavy metal transporter [Candidatus Wolfebacteria bacterium]
MNHSHNSDGNHAESPQEAHVSSLKKFIPLITIFAIIILFTVVMQLARGGFDLLFSMGNFMGSFFIIFGGFKLVKWSGFVEAYRTYDVLAKKSVVYAYAYPLIEIALGVAYLTAFELLITNWVTLIIMVISSIGVARELAKKVQIPCACLGAVFKIPMTKVTLFEDILMAVMALIMILLM